MTYEDVIDKLKNTPTNPGDLRHLYWTVSEAVPALLNRIEELEAMGAALKEALARETDINNERGGA